MVSVPMTPSVRIIVNTVVLAVALAANKASGMTLEGKAEACFTTANVGQNFLALSGQCADGPKVAN